MEDLMKRLRRTLILLPLLSAVAFLAACGGDPTPTPIPQSNQPTPTPTFAPRATPTPTATPTPQPAPANPVAWLVERWEINDDKWLMRTGETDKWGFAAGDEIPSNTAEGLTMTVRQGDIIHLGSLRSSSSSTTRTHNFTITEYGIDVAVPSGDRFPYTFTADKMGEFAIHDSLGDDHGPAKLVVLAAGAWSAGAANQPDAAEWQAEQDAIAAAAAAEAASGVVAIDEIKVEDGLYELRVGTEPLFGYGANARPKSTDEGGIVITMKVGQTLKIGEISSSGSRSSMAHGFSIVELGIEFIIPPGESAGENIEIKFDTAGEFDIVDTVGDIGGIAKVIVTP